MGYEIEILKRTKAAHLRRFKDAGCECFTKSGSCYFPESDHQCDRLAVYKIDGINLCKQHAGDKLLSDELKLFYVHSQKGLDDVD
jgi:hypothetical protein